MTDEILTKIKEYVQNGGTAIFTYCHFNMTDCNDKPMLFADNEKTKDLFGLEKKGVFVPQGMIEFADKAIRVEGLIHSADFKINSAKVIASDMAGNPVAFENKYGKGRFVLIGFSEYAKSKWAVDVIKHTLEIIGEEGDTKCDNPNISFVRYDLPNGQTRFDLLNMKCAVKDGVEEFNLKYKDKILSANVKEGEILKIYC